MFFNYLHFTLVHDQVVLVHIPHQQLGAVVVFVHVVVDLIFVVVLDLASAFEPSDGVRRGEGLVQTMDLSIGAFFGVEVALVMREEGRICEHKIVNDFNDCRQRGATCLSH